jgi:hypothetical protein
MKNTLKYKSYLGTVEYSFVYKAINKEVQKMSY